MDDVANRAWNNFIFSSKPDDHEKGSQRWAASVAALFMGLACNGGFYYFLEYSCDIDARDVEHALEIIGAASAAARLGLILDQLGRPLPRSTQEERERVLSEIWSESLNDIDTLQGDPYSGLMVALEAHVQRDASFYIELGADNK